MIKKVRIPVFLLSVFLIILALNTCDLFEVSLVEYLKTEQDSDTEEPDDGPYVYVAVGYGDDTNNSGWSRNDPVKTIGKALDIWAAIPSAEAKIMLLEDIDDSYTEAASTSGLIDFSTLLTVPRAAITGITLAGAGGGKTIRTDGQNLREVMHIANSGKTITLKNLTITRKKGDTGRGITVSGGDLVISGGVIIENNTFNLGAGVWLADGTKLTMTGGEIRFNEVKNSAVGGGGVYLAGPNSEFTLKAGTIRDNTSDADGGGVSMMGGGKITMEGGTISGNTAVQAGGGVYIRGSGAEFTMEGGTVSGNKAIGSGTGKGGGVCVAANGTFTMKGGDIKKNESDNDGGGVYISGSSSTQLGKASITRGLIGGSSAEDGNTAKYGGGLFVGNYGTADIGVDGHSGDGREYPYIQHNTGSITGGGIVINGSDAAKAVFHHGTVENNNGSTKGGGIQVVNTNGTLDMRGGTVRGNSATEGPGIMIEDGYIIMSDHARIMYPSNPLYLFKQSGFIRIGLSGFSAVEHIAIVTTASYSATHTILQGDSDLVKTFCDHFKVDNKDFGSAINTDGTLK
jgi:hypothetical protein